MRVAVLVVALHVVLIIARTASQYDQLDGESRQRSEEVRSVRASVVAQVLPVRTSWSIFQAGYMWVTPGPTATSHTTSSNLPSCDLHESFTYSVSLWAL